MIQTKRLTIIVSDGAVYTDSGVIVGLDFSGCNVPENIHALQWNNPVWRTQAVIDQINALPYGQGTGWIEYASDDPNENISSLPDWAIGCYNVYVTAANNE